MSNYLLIESRESFDTREAGRCCELAVQLRRAGHAVVLFLVQNGVLPARRDAKPIELHHAIAAGITVLADDVSLRERGIGPAEIASGVEAAPLEQAVKLFAAGWKTMFH
jgi:hypothetical protein